MKQREWGVRESKLGNRQFLEHFGRFDGDPSMKQKSSFEYAVLQWNLVGDHSSLEITIFGFKSEDLDTSLPHEKKFTVSQRLFSCEC